MNMLTGIKKYSVALGIVLLLAGLGQGQAQAATLNLPDVPLFVLNTVDPNLLLTLDDSGSMAWAFIPDGIGSSFSGTGVNLSGNNRACSKQINGLYYEPTASYTPPVDANGNSFANASFTAAWNGGYTLAGPAGPTVNLATGYRPSWGSLSNYTTCGTAMGAGPNYGGAFYYNYNTACGNPNSDACYTLVQHGNAAAGGNWSAAQQQNFANWYSYYRTRNLLLKTAGGQALAQMKPTVRLAYQHLNTCNAAFGSAPTASCPGTYVKPFAGTDRSNFYTWLYNTPTNNGTPLVQAAERARVYLTTSNANSPWAETPGTSVGTEYSCRQNFHLMLTDGYWNGGTVGANVDGTAGALPDGMAYPGSIPANRQIYQDNNVGYLADVVFRAWREDARPTLTDDVPRYLNTISLNNPNDILLPANAAHYWNPANDPANWQHMSTYTVGLGLTGTLDPSNYFNPTVPDPASPPSAGDYDDLLNGTKNWNAGDEIDDLWHAAVNGRGEYFSAKNSATLVSTFAKVLNQIASRSGSAAALSANGSTSSGNTSIFQVTFNTSNWTGRLISRLLDSNGTPTTTNWEAGSSGLNTQNYAAGRNIFTYNPTSGQGVPFQWGNLSATQQDALNRTPTNALDTHGSERLDYLRGASVNEGGNLNFRVRTCFDITGVPLNACPANVGKLGDIINSAPTYVGKPAFGYPDTLEVQAYSAFKTSRANRTKMVYVGANDGMLHGFRESDGRELMAYVPNQVYRNDVTNNLSLLTWSSYAHRYYVDGTPTMGDVFINGNWRTVLVGGLRKGGRGVYALDITDPSSFTENTANAQSLVKWEFTDPDLGYSFSQPTIVKVADSSGTGNPRGKWAAIFGNGYNNTGTGHAVLFVVDIETGTLLRKIDTSVSGGGGNLTTPNGLATPTVVDVDDDNIADYVYAGDLLGKMWRFDLRSSTNTDWALTANVKSIFTAVDSNNAVQPITTRPSVGFHPQGFGGLMVYFGSGKYLESSDNSTTGTQQVETFYGIFDRGAPSDKSVASNSEAIGRTDLLQQTISTNVTVGGYNTRSITNNPISYRLSRTAIAGTYLGWYVNLPTTGERQVTDSVLRADRIIFTTVIPSDNPCTPGGAGWLMELNVVNGGQFTDTFDLNGDGVINAADRITAGGKSVGAAGVQSTSTTAGAPSMPYIVNNLPGSLTGKGSETKLSSTQGGNILSIGETTVPAGRESWRQVK
jgi:type IV pilus assembly protein PilY1